MWSTTNGAANYPLPNSKGHTHVPSWNVTTIYVVSLQD